LPWVALAAVAFVVVGIFVLASQDSKKTASTASSSGAPTEIFLEPAASKGPSPFWDSAIFKSPPSKNTATTSGSSSSSSGGGGAIEVKSAPGTQPGLYGGTRNQSTCDRAAMIDFLEANPDKGKAWADAQGIAPSDLRSYIMSLTPVFLERDTRVTNHGFANGVATPHQSVLEAGTAVLVDNTGLPRARCACGNPLLAPEPSTQNFVGDAWPGFDPGLVQVVSAGPPVDQLVITDVETGDTFVRPVGTDGANDEPGPDESTTTTTSTTQPSQPADVTSTGVVDASSTFGGNDFPASLAVDGDVTTSWFSAGDRDGEDSTYTWSLPGSGQMTFTTIGIVGNAQNARRDFRTGFGFDSVDVRVVDLSGQVTFEDTVSLAGTPDPDVSLDANAVGHEIVLVFHHHESPACGGFAELQVMATA
jgi:hypothetical protein